MNRPAWWCLMLWIACGGTRGTPSASATVEDLVWGGTDCRKGGECASGVCTGGTCVGYLGASTEEVREAIGPLLSAAAARGQGEEVRQALEEVLSGAGSDEFIRARAADAFRWLPPATGPGMLEGLEGDPSEPVRFFAARARHVRGDPAAGRILREFLRHPSEAVRLLAGRALETRKGPEGHGPINQ
ncbi:HEAT repeat domain-containing protein [Myxococcota bacterium]|nr:HEAT repeat domain-containing protein [Myxococcota bacterium]